MQGLYEAIVKALKKDAEAVGEHILAGRCKSMEEYREHIAKRTATLKAIDTVKAEFSRNGEGEDGGE